MKTLNSLREKVVERLGTFRAQHVLSTEEEAARIAQVLLPDRVEKVRISALLHDITKEYTVEQQIMVFNEFGIRPDDVAMQSPKVFHARTATLILPRDYPEYCSDEVLSAIEKHTTGSADMSVFDCILYLADYIEPLRKYEDCQKLRKYFWDGIPKAMDEAEKLQHLYKTMVMSFDMTIMNLLEENAVIAPETVAARNAFILKVKQRKAKDEF